MDEKEYITLEKYNELKARLEFLVTVERTRIAKALEFSAALGDRSENAEYHQAREDQAKNEWEIAKIENILKNAVIVTNRQSDVVGIGSTVVVQKEDGSSKKEYTIVGSEEADMTAGRISNNSPLGVSLIGKRRGDTFSVLAPSGEIKYKVVEVKVGK